MEEKRYKYLFFLKEINEMRNNLIIPYPLQMEVDLSSYCNLECEWCRDIPVRNEHKGFLDKNILYDIIIKYGIKNIIFKGGGEPTLYPDFDNIVKTCYDLGCNLGIVTNGVKKIKYFNFFKWIKISLDANNSELFLKLKKRDFYKQVLSNINEYTKNSNVKVIVSFIVTPFLNKKEVLREFSYVDVQFKTLFRNDKMGVDFIQEDHSDSGNFIEVPACYVHWINPNLGSDGSLYLCCFRKNESIFNIGNLVGKDFKDVWYNDYHKNLTARLLSDKDLLRGCFGCRYASINNFIHKILAGVSNCEWY